MAGGMREAIEYVVSGPVLLGPRWHQPLFDCVTQTLMGKLIGTLEAQGGWHRSLYLFIVLLPCYSYTHSTRYSVQEASRRRSHTRRCSRGGAMQQVNTRIKF